MISFSDFRTRATEDELMDHPDCDGAQLFRTLDQFHGINRLFSRVRGLLARTVLADIRPGSPRHLIDLGAGACDIPVWLLSVAEKRGLDLRITAIDTDPRVVGYARERYGHVPGLNILEHTALDLDSLAPFDYLFANHFLHHLPDEVIPTLLSDAHRLSRRGFVISDLRRSPWSYLGFSLIAHIYRDSFARTDGLISIRKGFRPSDFSAVPFPLHIRTRLPGRIQLLGGCFAASGG
jgi:2-polyprenyl-3-methyl-5-hydroxy-6-metoxy-1,4-benzoquinol methylase